MSVAPTIAVIFDMDGVMLDTEPLAHRALQMAGRLDGFELSDELCLSLVGVSERDSLKLIEEYLGVKLAPGVLLPRFHECYERLLVDGAPLKPGLLELVDFLDERRIPKAIATSTERKLAQRKLGFHGLYDRFAVIVTGDEVVRGKPAPDIFLKAAQRLGVTPETAYVLEDSHAGILAASAGGMKPIMIPDLLPVTDHLRSLAHCICSSLFEVKTVLEEAI